MAKAKRKASRGAAFKGSTPDTQSRALGVWLFYAIEGQAAAGLANQIRPGQIFFWRHDGRAFTNQLAVGDSVIVMIGTRESSGRTPGGQIIATGVLAADKSRRFIDTEQHVRRWPVLCTDAFQRRSIDRHEIEAVSGPLVRSEGAVHSLSDKALDAINQRLPARNAETVPVSPGMATNALQNGEPIDRALATRYSYIKPDEHPARVVLSSISRDWVAAKDKPRKGEILLWPADSLPANLERDDIVVGVLRSPGFGFAGSMSATPLAIDAIIIGLVRPEEETAASSDPVKNVRVALVTDDLHQQVTQAFGEVLGKILGSLAGTSTHAIELSPDQIKSVDDWLGSTGERTISQLMQDGLLLDELRDGDARQGQLDAYLPFRGDAPNESEDTLDRGLLAYFLGRRMHLIWCQINGFAPTPKSGPASPNAGAETQRSSDKPKPDPPTSDAKLKHDGPQSRDVETFIVHIDSPWGGGKTTFANFVARVLNPRDESLSDRHFLRRVVAPVADAEELKKVRLDEIFFSDPRDGETARSRWCPEARKPWIVARYNAWRDQYVQPPWWHVFLVIESAICEEIRAEMIRAIKSARNSPVSASKTVLSVAWRWLLIRLERFLYQIWNAKSRNQVTILALAAALAFIVWKTGAVTKLLSIGAAANDPWKGTKEIVGTVAAILAFCGVSLAALLTVISQSLTPDLDFTAEHRQVGVRDPIGRFRNVFRRILECVARPVLLIVDDIDRCEPQVVVEILRGFQTIVRSSRLFVLVLGDRSWIEKAHEIYHKDFADLSVGTEARLGERFVEKMFQLSFTLPAMKPEARERFTRGVLEGAVPPEATAQVELLREVQRGLRDNRKPLTVEGREEQVDKLKQQAVERGAKQEDVDTLANIELVKDAASDPEYERQVAGILLGLAPSLPNNPRQIKRIINAFAVYETVGRIYYKYQLRNDESDEEGPVRARRWRQLAIWVALATEWPDTWRALAREPRLIEAAYAGAAAERSGAKKALLDGLTGEEARNRTEAVIRRLTHDRLLSRLLAAKSDGQDPGRGKRGDGGDLFAQTPMEAAAIYEFNRIMWEPGFPMSAPVAFVPSGT